MGYRPLHRVMWPTRVAAMIAALLAAVVAVAQEPKSLPPLVEQNRPVSPSVVGTLLLRANAVELILLWRGRPGWYLGTRKLSGGEGGPAGTRHGEIAYGNTTLRYLYQPGKRTLDVQGVRIVLTGRENVVLVDHVDETPASVVVDVDTATGQLDASTTLGAFLGTSKKAGPFLRCDTGLPDPLFNRVALSHACDHLIRP